MASFFGLHSLQGKITSAYVALAVTTLMLGIIAYWDLLYLERQFGEGVVVSDLKDAVLEMRRAEKNLFLYGDPEAYTGAEEYAASSLALLLGHRASLDEITHRIGASEIGKELADYQRRLNAWADLPAVQRGPVEEEIRALGHRITGSVETLSQGRQRLFEEALEGSQWFLLLSMGMIGLAIVLLGSQLKRVALTPLKLLESRLTTIAEGRFNHLTPPSDDREFTTFTTAFNRMLKELEVRQRRMLQSEKLASLGILAAGVAHELNNPLSNISSSCQLLLEEFDEAEPRQLQTWLRQIDSETERGRNIVRTLLEFGSHRVFEKRAVGLADLIDETRTIIGKTLRQYAARLTLNIPSDLVIPVDKQRLQQLFINLIQNALHAGGKGVHLRISAMLCERGVTIIPDGAAVAGNPRCITEHAGPFIEILIADDGPGIPSDRLSKVFDPFYTTSEPGQGVGLGLFIVQEIVREHDGCLAIASRPGQGAQVIILLPFEELERD